MRVWDEITPQNVFNMPPAASAGLPNSTPGLARSGGPGNSDNPPLWHHHNAVFWAGLLIATTVGLVAASTEVKVGPFRAGASAGRKAKD